MTSFLFYSSSAFFIYRHPFHHHQYPPSNPNPFTHPTLDFNNKHPIAFT